MKKPLLFIFLLTICFQLQATDFQDSTHLSTSKILRFFSGNKYLVAPFTFYMPETNWVILRLQSLSYTFL